MISWWASFAAVPKKVKLFRQSDGQCGLIWFDLVWFDWLAKTPIHENPGE
jgi:hypothetical protein